MAMPTDRSSPTIFRSRVWLTGRCKSKRALIKTPSETKPETQQPNANASPKASPSPQSSAPPNVQQLVNRAVQEFDDYQRLTSEGKLAEAGKKLEEHKRTLEELKKAGSKLP